MKVSNNVVINSQPGLDVAGNALPQVTPLKNVVANCQVGLNAAGHSVTHVDALEKVVKITYRSIDIGNLLAKTPSETGEAISSQLRDTILFLESIRFIGIARMLFCPDKNGVYYLKNLKYTIQNRIGRVFLLAHTALKMVNGACKYNLMSLGKIGKYYVGQLPVFKLVYDGLYGIASIFNTWDATLGINKGAKTISLANKQIAKWEHRPTEIALTRIGDPAQIAKLEARYTGKLSKVEELKKDARLYADILEKLDTDPSSLKVSDAKLKSMRKECTAKAQQVATKLDKLSGKIPLLQERIAKIAARDFKGLAEDLAAKDIDYKVKKWKVIKANTKIDLNKNIMGFFSSIGKVAVIALALFFTAVNWWTFPCLLTVLALGTFSDSMGLGKILYREFKKYEVMPKPAAPMQLAKA